MKENRGASVLIGILYIVGTVAGICSVAFTGPSTADTSDIALVAANAGNVKIGLLFTLLMGFALAFIPVVAYPLFREDNRGLAIAFVVFRGGLETVTYFLTSAFLFGMTCVGRGFGDEKTLSFLKAMTQFPLTVFAFGIGAIIFYALLYRTRAVPRWLSVWGFIAIALHVITGFLVLFGAQTTLSAGNTLMNLPIFLQEMVLAVWLIVKGFGRWERDETIPLSR